FAEGGALMGFRAGINDTLVEFVPGVTSQEHTQINVNKNKKVSAGVGVRSDEVNPRWKSVVVAFSRSLFEPDIEALEALCSAVAAHYLVGQPAWLMLIAPPGSAKTEYLKSLSELPRTEGKKVLWPIDAVTPRTFLSGQFGGEGGGADPESSLLTRIG